MKIGRALVREILRPRYEALDLGAFGRTVPPERVRPDLEGLEMRPDLPPDPTRAVTADQRAILVGREAGPGGVTVLQEEPLAVPDTQVVRVFLVLHPQPDPRPVVGLLDDILAVGSKVGILLP